MDAQPFKWANYYKEHWSLMEVDNYYGTYKHFPTCEESGSQPTCNRLFYTLVHCVWNLLNIIDLVLGTYMGKTNFFGWCEIFSLSQLIIFDKNARVSCW